MSLLNDLAGAMSGQPGAAANPNANATAAVIAQVLGMLQNRPGGLGGLLQAFQQSGIGHIFQSWIGTGQNLPVSTDQVRNVLGSDWVAKITQATGLPASQVEQHLSAVLPQIIDHLTPNGQMPQGDLGSVLANAAQRMLRA
ncbi:MAG TPA: YidB family protein [Steroidobacteraceae bacterium]|nr:YidB family protein [Steroidobacteraceae bacterium]